MCRGACRSARTSVHILDGGRFNVYGQGSLMTPFACFNGVAVGSLLGVQVLPYVT